MNKTLNTIILTSILFGTLVFTPKAFADCQAIYGGSQNCTTSYTFTVQKYVQVPGKAAVSYVNNLSVNDAKYAPNQIVNFRINVTNTSSQNIPTLTVKDLFPEYLNYATGSGSFEETDKSLTFTVKDLRPGETKSYYVSGKIVDSTLLPDNQGVVCMVNQVTGADANGAINTSTSQFCVTKQVLGSTYPVYTTKGGLIETPATGPEMLTLFGLIPAGLGGLFLRKKSIKK